MKTLKEECSDRKLWRQKSTFKERCEDRKLHRKKYNPALVGMTLNQKCAYYKKKRRKYIKLATPEWADKHKMFQIGTEAVNLSKRTGVGYVVDHIIPLKNPLVCGLNWEGNFQVITAKENLRKGNSFTIA